MPVNHLVIGLGGTGGKCLYGLRQMMYQNQERRFEPDTANVRYLWVDSSSIDLAGLHKSFPVLGGSAELPAASKLRITGNLGIRDVLNQPQAYPSIAPWLGDPRNYQGILNVANAAELQAAQVRRLGRMLFAQNITVFRARVMQLVKEMREAARPGIPQEQALDIHLLCGLAGGTGSGSIVDAVAACRHLYPAGSIRVFIYAMLPEEHPSDGRAGRNYHANGYAALRELSALSVGAWLPHNLADSNGERFTHLDNPFDACFLFTEENRHRHLEVDRELPLTVASFLYQLIAESRRLSWARQNDVWQTQFAFQVGGNVQQPESSGGKSNRPLRSRRFMSFGIKTISFPQVEVREYLTYTYCQAAARQALFNAWHPERGYEERVLPRGFATTARTPEYRAALKVSDAHLSLDTPMLQEEEKLAWHSARAYWETVAPVFERGAQEREFPLQMGKLHELCRDAFETKYRGSGVKAFYDVMRRQSMRQHAEEIRRRVEDDIRARWMQGDHGLFDTEVWLKELIAAMADWRADQQRRAEERGESGKRVTELNAAIAENNQRYAKCGIASRAAGTHRRCVNANRILNQEKFQLLTQAEGHRYAADLLPHAAGQLERLLAEVTRAREAVVSALEIFTESRRARCRDEDANRYDHQVVRYYEPREARDVASDLAKDDHEQRRQSALLRRRIEERLGGDWTFVTWSQLSVADLVKLFEDCCEEAAVQGHDALVAREKGRRPVLQANIIAEIQQRLGGKEEELAKFGRDALAGAQNLLPLSQSDVSLVVPGVLPADDRRNAIRYTTTVITMPPALDATFRDKVAERLKDSVESDAVSIVELAENAGRANEITIVRITSVMPARFAARTRFLKTAYDRVLRDDHEQKLTELHIESGVEALPDLYPPTYSAEGMRPWVLLASHMPVGRDRFGTVHMVDARPNPSTGREAFYHWGQDRFGALEVIKEFGATEDEILNRAQIQDLESLKEAVQQELETRFRSARDRDSLFADVLADYQRRTEGLPANDDGVVAWRAARETTAQILGIEVKTHHAQAKVSV